MESVAEELQVTVCRSICRDLPRAWTESMRSHSMNFSTTLLPRNRLHILNSIPTVILRLICSQTFWQEM